MLYVLKQPIERELASRVDQAVLRFEMDLALEGMNEYLKSSSGSALGCGSCKLC